MHVDSLGPYEILREWGSSAVGRILLARDPRTDGDVSIQLVEAPSGFEAEKRAQAHDRLRQARSIPTSWPCWMSARLAAFRTS
jgi:hypothetical protein